MQARIFISMIDLAFLSLAAVIAILSQTQLIQALPIEVTEIGQGIAAVTRDEVTVVTITDDEILVDGLPVIGVAVYVETDGGGVCTAARLGVGGILPVVKRATAAEGQLVGAKAGDTEALDAALATAADEIDPQGDRWAEAEYRKLLIRDLGRQVVATAFERAMGGPA